MPSHFVTVQGIRLHVVIEGEGPAVLLLHGFPDSSQLWQHQIAALSSSGYRAIAPDLPGYGLSDKPAELQAYSMKQVQQLVLGLLDSLGVEKATVVGHDWGAALAWRIAITCPEHLERLVALSVGHPGAGCAAGGARQRARWWYMFFFQYQGVSEACLRADDWQLLREFLGEPSEVAQRYVEQLSEPGALTAALSWYRANFQPEAFGQTQLRPYPLISCPTLGVWSAGDVALVEEQMTASHVYVEPGLWQYRRLEGAGHWIPRDAAQQLSSLLLAFLGEGRGGQGGGSRGEAVSQQAASWASTSGRAGPGLLEQPRPSGSRSKL